MSIAVNQQLSRSMNQIVVCLVLPLLLQVVCLLKLTELIELFLFFFPGESIGRSEGIGPTEVHAC